MVTVEPLANDVVTLTFAQISNNVVENIIVSTQLSDLPNTNNYVQITDSTHECFINYSYDQANNVFIPTKPYNSWNFNYNTFAWEAPIALPSDFGQNKYLWDEANNKWELANTDTENILKGLGLL